MMVSFLWYPLIQEWHYMGARENKLDHVVKKLSLDVYSLYYIFLQISFRINWFMIKSLCIWLLPLGSQDQAGQPRNFNTRSEAKLVNPSPRQCKSKPLDWSYPRGQNRSSFVPLHIKNLESSFAFKWQSRVYTR